MIEDDVTEDNQTATAVTAKPPQDGPHWFRRVLVSLAGLATLALGLRQLLVLLIVLGVIALVVDVLELMGRDPRALVVLVFELMGRAARDVELWILLGMLGVLLLYFGTILIGILVLARIARKN
jgi:hypothetical protein